MIVKWAIIASIILLFVAYFVGGYMHAQRRIKKGRPPLAYHRVSQHLSISVHLLTSSQWLVRRSQRRQFAPQPYFSFQQQHANDGYAMNNYPPPPPAYNAAQMPPPPSYQPPGGASKVNPSQQYTASPGPPPSQTPLAGGNLGEGSASRAENTTPAPANNLITRFTKFTPFRR